MVINQEISLATDIPLQSVREFVMCWEVNEHARLELSGILEQGGWGTVQRENCIGTEITVFLAEGTGQGDGVLFRGLVQNVELSQNHGVGTVLLYARSASVKLDKDRWRCSFQDPSATYSDIAKRIAGMGDGAVICTTERKETARPFLCYQETAWEFLKRLVSHQGSCLIADIKTGRPNLWFGMRAGRQIECPDSWLTGVEIRKRYDKRENSRTARIYHMECRSSYSLGDWMLDQGKRYVIVGVEARLERGDLMFSYQMAADGIWKDACQNGAFTGMSLWGTVEETKGETVRVTFDMDGEEGKWFYPWRPETGNALYAMPETGAKVAVCFMSHEEDSGIAVRCLGQPPEEQKHKDKSATTPSKGKAELFAGSVNIKKNEERMELNDSNIGFGGSRVEIEAKGKVKLQARRFLLSAASEIRVTTE